MKKSIVENIKIIIIIIIIILLIIIIILIIIMIIIKDEELQYLICLTVRTYRLRR